MTKDRLRKALDLLDVNQSQLGRAFSVPDRQVRRWIAGDRDVPDNIAVHLEIMTGEKTLDQYFAEIKARHKALVARLDAERAPAAA